MIYHFSLGSADPNAHEAALSLLDESLAFVVIHDNAWSRGHVNALEQGCWSMVVDLSSFPDFVDGMWRFLV
jgi:hypothetical protein